MKTADGYIRVSQKAGRQGDSFISPVQQRETIEGWAKLRDVEIVDWHEDIDESGGKLDRPGLTKALERIKAGATDGIAFYKLDRFSRAGVPDALKIVEEIYEAGGSIAFIDIGLDPTTPFGEFGMTIMLAMARMERRRLADSYADAQNRALADGVHIAVAPIGYVRESGKRSKLVPDPSTAPLVRECFLRRAAGDSHQVIANFMVENGVPKTRSGVASLLKNRVYVGEARNGATRDVNPDAHEPIVTSEEFDRAQKPGPKFARDGSIAALGMLSGLITCAGCGKKLSVLGGGAQMLGPNGERQASYSCKGVSAAGKCPAPCGARVAKVDEYVRAALSHALTDGTLRGSVDTIARYNRAAEAVTKAQADLDALADVKLLATFGAGKLAEMGETQKLILESARQRLRETPEPKDAIEPTSDLWDETWPIDRQRQLAKQFIAEVTLTSKVGGKGHGRAPMRDRIAIRWIGHDDFDTTIADRLESIALDHLMPA